MRLQRGKFVVKTVEELEKVLPDNDNIKKVIDLDYMRRIE